jgi:hypothetical protein
MHLTVHGLNLKICGQIWCQGANGHAAVNALDDTSPVPHNETQGNSGFIFVPRWQFEWFRDLLRNEKPVFCVLDDAKPRKNRLSTTAEPVGEEEV